MLKTCLGLEGDAKGVQKRAALRVINEKGIDEVHPQVAVPTEADGTKTVKAVLEVEDEGHEAEVEVNDGGEEDEIVQATQNIL